MKRNTIPSNRLDIQTPILPSIHLPDPEGPVPPDIRLILTNRHTTSHTPPTRLVLITPASPRPVRRATEILAHYFKREFYYDFAGYTADEQPHPNDRVFLLTQHQIGIGEAAVGVIVFRWHTPAMQLQERYLAWLWIHPYLRGKGLLSSYWPGFLRAYGTFLIEPPLSPTMKHFLRTHAPLTLQRLQPYLPSGNQPQHDPEDNPSSPLSENKTVPIS
ncbi:hypothetical protein KDH_27630 [Dictyobacter sp. S3.2.2.5]|uniref:N-acetyltransferase domain-containing protein n=1 Tax=Dictyobacter halimunensis TaxID=3026934 RepID=A0ABQ6FNW9_9CHLR|nr:hypothetical protein KDH_27630 [Dictyobacter sp. S3.2.2.5]